ncbi:MAG: GTPase RsgA, partial [Anaerolineales bacterium]
GRHTTTQVVLHRLEMGGCVVDTPGMREFGLSSLRRGELANYYPEIATLATACHFGDCAHIYEPGCAVKEAVHQGQLPASRHNSYQKIYHSLPA